MENEQVLFSASFTVKFELVFSKRFHFKANRKGISSCREIPPAIFEIALPLRDRHVLCGRPEIVNVFNTLALKQIFWKAETFLKKLEYRFLVEITKIENTTFPYKTPLSEANVKTNRIGEYKMGVSQRTEFHFFW